MEKDGACKMDTQNKTCSCAIKSERIQNNAGIHNEEEKKLAGPVAKKVLPAEGWSRRNSKREEGQRQKKISDNRQQHSNGLYADTKRKAVKKVELLSFQ